MRKISLLFISLVVLLSCSEQNKRLLYTFDVYCEMVSNHAKPIAFSQPLNPPAVDLYWNQFLEASSSYGVELYREDSLPVSALFPEAATNGKTVIIIYSGDRLEQYKQWKKDALNTQPNDLEIARRLGRLLGYDNQGINKLLAKNTSFRSLSHYNVTKQVTHFYYKNPGKAQKFYRETLGLKEPKNNIFKLSEHSYLKIDTLNEVHPEGQDKSTALALLTDQLADWYTHCQNNDIPIKYTYKPKTGGPHDGFVAIDPEGYLLEFEQFKQHPENELLMAVLKNAPKVPTSINNLNFYGSITWTYHRDLLLLQNFYEYQLGFRLVADQGWTKIYQTSPTGFIGLVDERRGMNNYADRKAVEIEWSLSQLEEAIESDSDNWNIHPLDSTSFVGPEKYIYRLSAGL